MFAPLRKIFRARPAMPRPSVPEGERIYVMGDVHGRIDLFQPLVHAIENDDVEASPATTTIVLLGDLVDRGPDSAGVVASARALQTRRKVRILAGNHEEMFLESFEDRRVLRHFLKHGGRETLFSYGITRDRYNESTLDELQQLMRDAVPEADRQFLSGFEEYVIAGDYLFVHAGIRPEVRLEEQSRHDLLWIRDQFLHHAAPHSHVVVHGHTICDPVDERANRIGIDTGAYRTGKLTALVLEGDTRRYIQAVENAGTVTVRKMETAQ
ncbi:serine/threonine protein phosphatase [Pelagerythrobacter rhizovicinus]|uniref:Serine/threonine protein phosphatase n=2 Tax=Pelagerythrobacter rhizovicinus TaxID=2268576 RepID=A0A4Q2KIW7_9SPHN|nr:serine/threonine protein phosphatase [Pelagerythrobacter rhizovicinus]